MTLEDTALSYDEWKASGFYIKRGSKSKSRDVLGVPQFTADQVCREGTKKSHYLELKDAHIVQ